MLHYNTGSEPPVQDTKYERWGWNAIQLEEEILALDGLVMNYNIRRYDVQLKINGGFLHTLEAGWSNKEIIVMIHGFGASAVYWGSMIAHLQKDYHVYAVDIAGFGLSSRPIFQPKSYEDSCRFVCDSFEEWRQNRGIRNFNILAHSFGGYMCISYLKRYIQNIQIDNLFLISPAGMTKSCSSPGEREGKGAEILNQSTSDTVLGHIVEWSFNIFQRLGATKLQLLNFMGKRGYFKEMFRTMPLGFDTQNRKDLHGLFYDCISGMHPCGEKTAYFMLTTARYADIPIVETLDEMRQSGINLPQILIMYGQNDWMDRDSAIYLNSQMNLGIRFEIIKEATHMTYKNRETVAHLIREQMSDLNKSRKNYSEFSKSTALMNSNFTVE